MQREVATVSQSELRLPFTLVIYHGSAIYKKHGEDKLCASTAAPCSGRKNMLISSSATAKLPGRCVILLETCSAAFVPLHNLLDIDASSNSCSIFSELGDGIQI